MITSIEIENFLSHKHTTLDLDPGVNAIIGSSDSGKTAIFNALNWCINNRPSGDEFRSWWGGGTGVYIRLDDNLEIARMKKGTTINSYEIINPDIDNQILTGFGQQVPSEISQIFNMSDINFQFQHSDAFLLSDSTSPGQIAKYLNQVVDLELIDVALYNINARYRQETQNLDTAEIALSRLNDEIKEYDWLPKAEGCLVKLEAQEQQIAVEKRQFRALSDLLYNIGEVEREITLNRAGPIRHSEQVSHLLQMDADIADLKIEYGQLDEMIKAIHRKEKEIEITANLLKHEKDLKAALKLDSEIEKLNDEYNLLQQLIHDIEKIELDLDELKSEIITMEARLADAFPNICPLCNQEVKNVKRKRTK